MKITGLATLIALTFVPVPSYALTIMSFNVENLFDVNDDPDNPHDNTYLPLSVKQQDAAAHNALCEANNRPGFYREQCKTLDWSEQVYETKLAAIGEVLSMMPEAPDVVVMPETENRTVIDDLVGRYLSDLGYGTVVQLDSSDEPVSRGIDVAVISKLPLAGEPKATAIDFKGDAKECGKTRDIVHVPLQLPNGEVLNVFGVHFPSGGNPLSCRVRAMTQLNELHAALGEDSLAIAAGDFNFSCGELQSDAFERLAFRGNWYLSPVVRAGCTAPGSNKYVDRLLYNWNTWSFLDLILVSPGLSPTQPTQKNWFADLGSFQTVVVSQNQIAVDDDDKGFIEPRRFDPVTGLGVSDHWPVMMRLMNRRQ